MNDDLLLIGGGLASGVTAWALHQKRPEIRFRVIERESSLGGNHTWSFHESDVTPEAFQWLRPLISKTWPGYSVRFPKYQRFVNLPYCSIRSGDFDAFLRRELGEKIILNSSVVHETPSSVLLSSGVTFSAKCVLDARGTYENKGILAYQKFLGQFIETKHDHGLETPILMDALVPQIDGYRFVYVLPWDARTLLVEDTYYSDNPHLNLVSIRARILQYCLDRKWEIKLVHQEENGVLPIPLRADSRLDSSAAKIGMSAGLFHPTTGFSVPDAVRTASIILASTHFESLKYTLENYRLERFRETAYFRRLNQMLFWGAKESKRYRVLERFYRMPESTIAAFYRGKMTWGQKAKVLVGRPPISLLTLGHNLWERRFNEKYKQPWHHN